MTAAVRSSYAAIWVATAVGILVAGLTRPLFDVDAPRDALQASPATVIDLLVHNTLVALWPLALVALDWPRLRGARTAGDVLVAGQLAVHGLLIGVALGQQPSLWRYLPHLPAEWLGLAIAAAGWLYARRADRPPAPRALAGLAACAVAVLAVAAIVETWAVPL